MKNRRTEPPDGAALESSFVPEAKGTKSPQFTAAIQFDCFYDGHRAAAAAAAAATALAKIYFASAEVEEADDRMNEQRARARK